MLIQFNTDNNIPGSESLRAPLEALIEKGLSRFAERITRVEVHLNDENSHKVGNDDINCMLEAKLEGMQPIAVNCNANAHDQAVRGAIDKLKSALDTAIGKSRNH